MWVKLIKNEKPLNQYVTFIHSFEQYHSLHVQWPTDRPTHRQTDGHTEQTEY